MADSSTSQTLLQDMCSDTSAGRTLCRRLRKAWNLHWYPCLPHLCFRMDHGRSADHATKFPVFRDMPQSPVWGTRNGPACSSKYFVSNRYSSRSEISSWRTASEWSDSPIGTKCMFLSVPQYRFLRTAQHCCLVCPPTWSECAGTGLQTFLDRPTDWEFTFRGQVAICVWTPFWRLH